MACRDKSIQFLKNLGYNVVRHPRAGIGPLELIGRQHGSVLRLGTLDQLVRNAQAPLPSVEKNQTAGDINGQTSSSLNLGIGVNILGAVIGAMGGSLGINTSYTNAKKVTFIFTEVLRDRVRPLDIGEYLKDGEINADNLVLREFVLGKGELFIITDTVKSKKFSVQYVDDKGVEAAVNVPTVAQLLGGDISVAASGSSNSTLSFEGNQRLTFGFKCFQVGVDDGDLRVMISKAGTLGLEAMAREEDDAADLTGDAGLLDLQDS